MQIFPCHLKEGSDYFFKNGTVLFVKKLMKSLLLRVKETTGLTQLRILFLFFSVNDESGSSVREGFL